MSSELDYSRVRMATKFSLWAWALYWPGGGVMIFMGGMPIASILLTIGSLLCFLGLILYGQLGTEDSNNRLQLFMERPLYLVGVLFALAIFAPLVGILAVIGLHLFATLLMVGTGFLLYTLIRFDASHEGSPYAHKTDQMYIAAGIGFLAAFIMTLDSIFYAAGAPFIQSGIGVAGVNWMGILYPVFVLVASRGIMAPLRRIRLVAEPQPDAEAVPE